MRFIFLMLMVSWSHGVTAQPKQKVIFNSYTAVGFLAGKSPVALTAQTVNGLAFHKWFVGAGFGVDEYHTSTLPLFVDVKKAFEIKRKHLFLYADLGTHFITRHSYTRESFVEVSTKGTLYVDAGAGVKIKTGKRSHLFFTLGNSLKKMTKEERVIDGGFPFTTTTNYDLSRITMRMGFQF